MLSTFTGFELFVPSIPGAASVSAKKKKKAGYYDMMKTVLWKIKLFFDNLLMYAIYKMNW